MTTSGSTDWSVTASEIIDGAARVLGVLGAGQTLPSETQTVFKEGLNMLIKQLMAPNNTVIPGLKMFQRVQSTLPLTTATDNKYEIAASGGDLDLAVPIDIIDAVLRSSSNEDTPLKAMTESEYMAIPSKSSSGTPTKYYYERHASSGYLYLDCIPSDTSYSIFFTGLRVLEDIDSASDNVDFPVEWSRFLKWKLALELWPEYPTSAERLDMIQKNYTESLLMVQSFAPESETQIYFQPDKD